MRRRGARLGLLLLPPLLALAGCADSPADRRVRAEFACEDGRKLRAVFYLDRATAELRVSRREVAEIPAIPGVPGRAYAGQGWELRGLGDGATLTSPGGAPVHCTETR